MSKGRKKFSNKIPRRITPDDLVPSYPASKAEDELAGIFLTLALIFNDLKSLTLIHDEFFSLYEKPSGQEVDSHTGEWSGIDLQFFKIPAGTLLKSEV